MTPAMKRVLRLEGLAYLVFALFIYHTMNGSWWTFAILFFAPDIAFAAYLAGPRVGAIAYNILHSTIGPILLAIAGYALRSPETQLVAIIWLAHCGMDRMLGYGLKHTSGFTDTHLDKL
jgi:hypothetical protein